MVKIIYVVKVMDNFGSYIAAAYAREERAKADCIDRLTRDYDVRKMFEEEEIIDQSFRDWCKEQVEQYGGIDDCIWYEPFEVVDDD